MVTVPGDIDGYTGTDSAPRSSPGSTNFTTGQILVIDLTDVTFLSSKGLQLLRASIDHDARRAGPREHGRQAARSVRDWQAGRRVT